MAKNTDDYKQIKLAMPPEEADAFQAYCKDKGLKMAPLIRELLKAELAQASLSEDGLGPVSQKLLADKGISKEKALLERKLKDLDKKRDLLLQQQRELDKQ